jgi:helvolic acid biosynthesis cytochrome P450 monooxygenase
MLSVDPDFNSRFVDRVASMATDVRLVPILATLFLVVLTKRLTHAFFLSPLRKLPGPLLARLTSKRGDLDNFSGRVAQTVENDTAKYGEI